MAYQNGSRAQIQEALQKISNDIGELKGGQEALVKSVDEFKSDIKHKVDEHEMKINQAEGSLGTWKWIVGGLGISGLFDLLLQVRNYFK